MNRVQIFAANNYCDGDMASWLLKEDGETLAVTEDEVGEALENCGDTLFAFVVVEAGDVTDEAQDEHQNFNAAAIAMRNAADQLNRLADRLEAESDRLAPGADS
jgi:hypothetical protein